MIPPSRHLVAMSTIQNFHCVCPITKVYSLAFYWCIWRGLASYIYPLHQPSTVVSAYLDLHRWSLLIGLELPSYVWHSVADCDWLLVWRSVTDLEFGWKSRLVFIGFGCWHIIGALTTQRCSSFGRCLYLLITHLSI
jgi:hypothetical protein